MEQSNDPPVNNPLRPLNHMDIHIPIIPNILMNIPNIFINDYIPEIFDEDDLPDKPAEKEFIDSLQEVQVDQEMFDREIECSICLDRFQIGDTCIKLPCENPHFFHTGDNKEVCEGIKPWFQLNHNCPVCRHSFPGQPDKPDKPDEADEPDEPDEPDEADEPSEETTGNNNGANGAGQLDESIERLLMNRFNQILHNPINHIFNPPIQMNNMIDQFIGREEDRQLQEAIRLSLDDS
jgi:hypothetical protein